MNRYFRKDRIKEYLANIDRQLEDLEKIKANQLQKEFFNELSPTR